MSEKSINPIEAAENANFHLKQLMQKVADGNRQVEAIKRQVEGFRIQGTIEANTYFLENATRVLRIMVEHTETRKHFEETIFAEAKKFLWEDKDIFAILVEKPKPQQPDSQLYMSHEMPIGGHRPPEHSYNISIVVPVREKVLQWSQAKVAYCLETYEVSLALVSSEIERRPDFEDYDLIKTLLYLQTPETALRFIVQKFPKKEEKT